MKPAGQPGLKAFPAPGQPNPTPAPPPRKPEEDLAFSADQLYGAVVTKDLESLMAFCRPPFFFEGKAISTDAEIRRKWQTSLANQPLESVRYLGMQSFTYDEMVARHGKPPDRLAAWPLKSGVFTVGNLGGHAAIVLWRKSANGSWQAVGFHD
ncbi:MAG: hypothetical protein HY901_05930 [Deltaproteobacteria bacterium]|nr:hypothetical protein [Deltaproteobacteria bacterium]